MAGNENPANEAGYAYIYKTGPKSGNSIDNTFYRSINLTGQFESTGYVVKATPYYSPDKDYVSRVRCYQGNTLVSEKRGRYTGSSYSLDFTDLPKGQDYTFVFDMVFNPGDNASFDTVLEHFRKTIDFKVPDYDFDCSSDTFREGFKNYSTTKAAFTPFGNPIDNDFHYYIPESLLSSVSFYAVKATVENSPYKPYDSYSTNPLNYSVSRSGTNDYFISPFSTGSKTNYNYLLSQVNYKWGGYSYAYYNTYEPKLCKIEKAPENSVIGKVYYSDGTTSDVTSIDNTKTALGLIISEDENHKPLKVWSKDVDKTLLTLEAAEAKLQNNMKNHVKYHIPDTKELVSMWFLHGNMDKLNTQSSRFNFHVKGDLPYYFYYRSNNCSSEYTNDNTLLASKTQTCCTWSILDLGAFYCDKCNTCYDTLKKAEECGARPGCPSYSLKCPNCDTEYSTEEEKDKCSFKEGCPNYSDEPRYKFHSEPELLPAGTDGSAGTDATYVLFGDYPKSVKKDNVTIFVKKTKEVGSFTYNLGSDGNYYFHDYNVNTKEENYFLVEPIKWRVLTKNNNYYDVNGNELLLAEDVLYSTRFNPDYNIRKDGDDDILPNDYSYSAVREFLNGTGFLQTAFTPEAQEIIADTTVKNGYLSHKDYEFNTIEEANFNTCTDKIFLLSISEITDPSYGFDSKWSTKDTARGRKFTDYATLVSGNNPKAYMLRSSQGTYTYSDGTTSGLTGYRIAVQYADGTSTEGDSDGYFGVCPALTINRSKFKN